MESSAKFRKMESELIGGDAESCRCLGNSNLQQGKYAEALKAYKCALEFEIGTYGPWDSIVGAAYCRIGNVYNRMQMPAEALAMYERT